MATHAITTPYCISNFPVNDILNTARIMAAHAGNSLNGIIGGMHGISLKSIDQ